MISKHLRRWAVPTVVAVGVGAGLAVNATMSAGAAPSLPSRSAAQLVADVSTAHVSGLSGTVVENASLGLPALPDTTSGKGSANLSSLISGSHTLRVWYGGPREQRVALLGSLGESDVVHNGRDVWLWSSDQNAATHYRLPATSDARHHPTATQPAEPGLPTTPLSAAQKAIANITPTTKVSVDQAVSVAGRPSYELSIAPRQAGSLVGSIRIAVDGTTHVPLRVQVYAAGAASPAIAIGFTQVSFDRPNARQFQFTPPQGATVKQGHQSLPAQPGAGGAPAHHREGTRGHGTTPGTPAGPATVGTGWTSVLVLPAGHLPSSGGAAGGQLGSLQAAMTPVSGAWGSGRLLRSALFSALLTDDGRLLVGTVPPAQLYAAAAHR